MAFGLFRKRRPDPAAPAGEPEATKPVTAPEPPAPSDGESAREILELLELELGAMIRQLDRAANAVAGGAEATAATLNAIRERTDALTGRTSAAQSTASTFAQAADKFTHSAEGGWGVGGSLHKGGTRGESPSPDRLRRSDLSPQAGRG